MSTPALAETQRNFFAAILSPLRGRSRRSTELPPSDEPHAETFLATAERYLRPSPTHLPAECLELYHRQYWFRLLDSLEEDFPGLIRLIGRECFWEITEAYLLRHPSASFTLRHLGSRLPGFLAEYLTDPVMNRRAVALAEIEWSSMASFEAAEMPVSAPEQVAGGTFTLQPYVVLLECAANASDWLNDAAAPWQDDSSATFPTAIWRRADGRIFHEALEAGAYHMLSRIAGHTTTLDAWLAASAADIPDTERLSRWFSEWSSRGWLALSRSLS